MSTSIASDEAHSVSENQACEYLLRKQDYRLLGIKIRHGKTEEKN